MTPLLDLEGEPLRQADELLDRAAHDVAKYMAMTARNIDPQSISARELDHLREDLLRTDGASSAWALWATFSQGLSELCHDPAVSSIDRLMSDLETMTVSEHPKSADLALLVVKITKKITALRRAVRQRLIEARG